jgi:ParB-like chromosome segregation protein Spo0J
MLRQADISSLMARVGRSGGRTEPPPQIRSAEHKQDAHLVRLSALMPADSPRLRGENLTHIQMLAEHEGPLPPILVHRATMRVIDGMHRLGAARLRGQQTIEVRFFDGTEDEAFVLAVKTNISHGLPLSRADRDAAVERIMAAHPRWSDRAIAVSMGLSPTTVAAIRRRTTDDHYSAQVRIGRDGRARPINAADGRRRAGRVIAENPGASLREIAKAAGISPSTARDVRERMLRGDDPVPSRQQARSTRSAVWQGAEPRGHARQRLGLNQAATLQNLKKDPSLRLAESGRTLLRWLYTHSLKPGEWRPLLGVTPPHCAYLIASLARDCAQEWLDFADQLDELVDAQGQEASTA